MMEWRKVKIPDEPLEEEFIIIIRDGEPIIGLYRHNLYRHNNDCPMYDPFIATTDGRFIEIKDREYYTYFNFPEEKEGDIDENI